MNNTTRILFKQSVSEMVTLMAMTLNRLPAEEQSTMVKLIEDVKQLVRERCKNVTPPKAEERALLDRLFAELKPRWEEQGLISE